MKKQAIKDLFRRYSDVIFPSDELGATRIMPKITVNEVKSDSLLFITDRVSDRDTAFDFSECCEIPIAAVASHTKNIIKAKCPIIRVKNPRAALAFAVSNSCMIDYEKIKIIGVTGTNGKTTTATLIYEMLRRCGYKAGFIGTGKIFSDGVLLSEETYSMTTPDPTLLYPSIAKMQNDGCEYIVMEISSHSISLGKIAPIRFEYAIFTNLDDDHLDFHGSKEEYFKAKLSLFSLAKRGLFNLDDEYSKRASQLVGCKVSTFGILNEGDAYATEISENDLSPVSFFYRAENLIFKAETRLIGQFNAYNALAALKCLIDLGIKPCIAKRALAQIKNVEGRMQSFDGEIRALIDYAHTPSAFINCLKSAKQSINSKQKLIVVFGCGGDRDKSKRSIFGMQAEKYADIIIITEDNSRCEKLESIVDDITSGIKQKKYEVIPDRETAIRRAFDLATCGDIVAVIGKGHERYKIVENEYIPFDERKIIIDAMKRKASSLCE